MLQLKEDKSIDNFIGWKPEGLYNSKLKQLYIDSFISINFSRYRKGIKFDQDHLAVEENSYEIKIVNAYIVYD